MISSESQSARGRNDGLGLYCIVALSSINV